MSPDHTTGHSERPLPDVLKQFELTGRVALVTGGHGELGEAIAATLAQLGCSVALAARSFEKCQQVADKLAAEHGIPTLAKATDVSNEADVEQLIADVDRQLGGLDIVVNSAATFWAAAPEDVPLERGWQRVLDVNLTGAFLVCRAAGRRMLTQKRGSIINVASTGGLMSFMPEVGSTLSYTTSKGALINLTRDLAAQWARSGIRVNAVAPGSINGGMTHTIPDENQREMVRQIPMGRQGRPEELQGAIAFLASDASSYVTGSVLVVDGGQTIV